MKEYFVNLTDGTRLPVNVNFGTLFYLQKAKGYYRIAKKWQKNSEKVTEEEKFEMAANIVYAVIRSNGRTVTFDEALSLMPPDTDQIEGLLKAFQARYEKYSKKKQAGQKLKNKGC